MVQTFRQVPRQVRPNLLRLSTTPAQNNLRAEGGEFLVLGNLLMRDIQSSKAYTRFPG